MAAQLTRPTPAEHCAAAAAAARDLTVVMVDNGGKNIGSVTAAFARLGVSVVRTTDAATIQAADRVVLPGVGSAQPAMTRLAELGLIDVVRELTQPVLGVCLGMQLLCAHSEEDGGVDMLGLVETQVRHLVPSPGVRVPHMGWSEVSATDPVHPYLQDLRPGDQAYFVHSYAAAVTAETAATASQGQPFAAAVMHKNFFGTQFHPERSAGVGQAILRRFITDGDRVTAA